MTKNRDISDALDKATTFVVSAAAGANVIANTTTVRVGNSAVNTTIGNNSIYVGNSTANSTLNSTMVAVGTSNVALLSVEDQVVVGGARVTIKDLGNLSGQTITPDPGDRPHQKITNNGAGTIAPGTNYGYYILDVINTTGAGTVTVSGWSNTSGASFDTTTTSKFRCHASVTADCSLLSIVKVA